MERIVSIRHSVVEFFASKRQQLKLGGVGFLLFTACVYLAYSIYVDFRGAIPLIVISSLGVIVSLFYGIRRKWGPQLGQWSAPHLQRISRFWNPWGRRIWHSFALVAVVIYLVVEIRQSPFNFVSLGGLAVFLLLCVIFSADLKQVPWAVVISAHLTQFLMGLVLLRWPKGASAVHWLADQLVKFINYGLVGAEFVFGENFTDHYFAMALMPILCYFNAVTHLLYHWGVIQLIIRTVGGLVFFSIGTSVVEAFVATSAIFFGPDVAILMVRSEVPSMSSSQLHSIMALGLATIDGGMIAVFEGMGIPARHLVSASFMSAPATLAYSKILLPDKAQDMQKNRKKIKFEKSTAHSSLAAFVEGAVGAVPIIAVVLAMLISSLSLLHFVNSTLTWFGHRVGIEELTIEWLCSYLLMPLTFLMGVQWEDCHQVSKLIGLKVVVNEMVAYTQLGILIDNRLDGLQPAISVRSEAVAAYALCGFSNFTTAGFMVGFLSLLAPRRKADIADNVFRCMVASNFACFSTAAIAGLLYKE